MITFTEKRIRCLATITPFHVDTIRAVFEFTKSTILTHKIIIICSQRALSPYSVLAAMAGK